MPVSLMFSIHSPAAVTVYLFGFIGALATILYLRRRIELLRQQNAAFHKEKKAVYDFLTQIGERMSGPIDLERTLEAIVSFLVEATRAQAGAAFLMDPSRESLSARVLVGMFPPFQETFDYALTKAKFLHQKIRKIPIPVGTGIIGDVAVTGRPVLISDARQNSRVPQTPGFEIDTFMAAPLIVQNRIEGVFALSNRIGGDSFTSDDLNVLRALAEQASITIQIVRMYDAMAEKQRIEQELRIAQDFQKMLLPKECPRIPGIEIAAANLPALEVGGDFYDFFWLDGDRLGIVIADVAGKGIPGALIMSMVRSVVRAESPHATSPRAVLERVNQTVFADTRERVFITMIFAILDLPRRTLTFARAGHEPLVAYSRLTGGMRLVAPDGIALGLVDDHLFSVIRDQEVELDDGDVAVLYTDGVIEAMDERSREYGQERFLEMLRTHAESPAEDLIHALVTDIRHFARSGRQSDDITLVVLKFNQLSKRTEAPAGAVSAAAAGESDWRSAEAAE
jgi:sigma-B regulation protein RsbU (phosphoserine phosphatase)